VKCSEDLNNRVSNIIGRYINRMKFAAFMSSSFNTSIHILLVPFFIVLYKVVCFVCFYLIL
jgi:hypothetical protein